MKLSLKKNIVYVRSHLIITNLPNQSQNTPNNQLHLVEVSFVTMADGGQEHQPPPPAEPEERSRWPAMARVLGCAGVALMCVSGALVSLLLRSINRDRFLPHLPAAAIGVIAAALLIFLFSLLALGFFLLLFSIGTLVETRRVNRTVRPIPPYLIDAL